jgi:hypothetical protein
MEEEDDVTGPGQRARVLYKCSKKLKFSKTFWLGKVLTHFS